MNKGLVGLVVMFFFPALSYGVNAYVDAEIIDQRTQPIDEIHVDFNGPSGDVVPLKGRLVKSNLYAANNNYPVAFYLGPPSLNTLIGSTGFGVTCSGAENSSSGYCPPDDVYLYGLHHQINSYQYGITITKAYLYQGAVIFTIYDINAPWCKGSKALCRKLRKEEMPR